MIRGCAGTCGSKEESTQPGWWSLDNFSLLGMAGLRFPWGMVLDFHDDVSPSTGFLRALSMCFGVIVNLREGPSVPTMCVRHWQVNSGQMNELMPVEEFVLLCLG